MRLLILLIASFLLQSSLSLQFFLEAKSKKCFHEDIPLSTDATLTYTVAQGDGDMPISLRVTDITGATLHAKDDADHGVFSFRAPATMPRVAERGGTWALHDDERDEDDAGYERVMPGGAGDDRLTYRFCFEHSSALGLPRLRLGAHAMKRRILFEVRFGADAKTMDYYEDLAKEKHLSSTEELFRVVEDRVSDVVRVIDEMRQRELRLSHMSVRTGRVVGWYSALACLCIAAGAVLSSHATFTHLSRHKVI